MKILIIAILLSFSALANEKIYETLSNMFFIYNDDFIKIEKNNLNLILNKKFRNGWWYDNRDERTLATYWIGRVSSAITS